MSDAILRNVPGMQRAASVPELFASNLSPDAFAADHVARSRPCIIRGAARHWPAAGKWRDKDYLKKLCRDYQVYFRPHDNHVTAKRNDAGERLISFAEAIDLLHAPETRAGTFGMNVVPAEMLADSGGIPFLANPEPGFVYPPIRYLFFRNAGSGWHYHPFDETLMCQVIGSKKIGLLNANGASYKPIRSIFFKDEYCDDASAFDGFDDTGLQWFSASLEEGDALYIPALWWHGVIALSHSFGITAPIVWRSPLHVIADSIRAMASGRMDMVGGVTSPGWPNLLDIAKRLGLERELAIALRHYRR